MVFLREPARPGRSPGACLPERLERSFKSASEFLLALAATGVNLAVSIRLLRHGRECLYPAADIGLGVHVGVFAFDKAVPFGTVQMQAQGTAPGSSDRHLLPGCQYFYLVSLAMVGNIYLQMYGVKLIFVNIACFWW